MNSIPDRCVWKSTCCERSAPLIDLQLEELVSKLIHSFNLEKVKITRDMNKVKNAYALLVLCALDQCDMN